MHSYISHAGARSFERVCETLDNEVTERTCEVARMMTTRFEVISASLELFQGQKAEQAMPFNVGGTILSLIWTPLGSGLTAKK